MVHVIATKHAFQRAKERAGWRRETLSRMLERIYFTGVGISTQCRKIREYLRHQQQKTAGGHVLAYGEHVFVFSRDQAAATAVLITVWQLPHEYRVAAQAARRKAFMP